MRAIGGFLGLEAELTGNKEYHSGTCRVNSGRAAFRLILDQIRPTRVLLPYYACHSLLEPLVQLGLRHEYYPLDARLRPAAVPSLDAGDCLLAINYFGLQSEVVMTLTQRYGKRVVIDNTQAFFERPSGNCFWFNSARKFFGVPDGAYAEGPSALSTPDRSNEVSIRHLEERSRGNLAEGYTAFKKAEQTFDATPRRMSEYTKGVLARLDYDRIAARRRDNFRLYDEAFRGINELRLSSPASAVPFCYPLLPRQPIDRAACHRNGIFFPVLWPEIATRETAHFSWEKSVATRLLPLPVDHRYGEQEIRAVIDEIKPQLFP